MRKRGWWYKGLIFGIWWAVFSWLPYFTGYWGKIHFLFSFPLMLGFAMAYIFPWHFSPIPKEIIAFILSIPFGMLLGYLSFFIFYKIYKPQAGR